MEITDQRVKEGDHFIDRNCQLHLIITRKQRRKKDRLRGEMFSTLTEFVWP